MLEVNEDGDIGKIENNEVEESSAEHECQAL